MSNPPQRTALPLRFLPGSPSLLFIPISSFSPFYFPILQSSDTVPPCFPLIRPWCAERALQHSRTGFVCTHQTSTSPMALAKTSRELPPHPPPGSPFLPSLLLRCASQQPLGSSAGHASLSALCKHGTLVRARTWPAFALFTLAEGIGGTPAVLRKRKHVLNGCLRDSRGDVSGARAGPSRVRPARTCQPRSKKEKTERKERERQTNKGDQQSGANVIKRSIATGRAEN